MSLFLLLIFCLVHRKREVLQQLQEQCLLSFCHRLSQSVTSFSNQCSLENSFDPSTRLQGTGPCFHGNHTGKKKGGMSERTDASVYVRVCAGIHLGWWFCVVLHTLFLSLNCLTLSHKTSHLHPSLLHHSLHLEYSSLSIIVSTETIPTYTLSDEAFF